MCEGDPFSVDEDREEFPPLRLERELRHDEGIR